MLFSVGILCTHYTVHCAHTRCYKNYFKDKILHCNFYQSRCTVPITNYNSVGFAMPMYRIDTSNEIKTLYWNVPQSELFQPYSDTPIAVYITIVVYKTISNNFPLNIRKSNKYKNAKRTKTVKEFSTPLRSYYVFIISNIFKHSKRFAHVQWCTYT